jgi:phosphohistidine phosphatase
MNLLLWRHAAAEEIDSDDAERDAARALTKRGHKQAEQIATWLHARLPAEYLVLASPAKRTRQTAEALTASYRAVDVLAPGAEAAAVLACANWPDYRGTVVIVGHQPTLGRVASLLIAGVEADWSIKKGALWWIANRDREGGTQTLLRAVVTPDLA